MKEEDALLKKIGKENAFKVPEGYFENLTSEVMDKLPPIEKQHFSGAETVTRWTKIKPLLYLAAMFAGAALIIRVASPVHKSPTGDAAVAEQDTEMISEQVVNTAVNGAMLDDYSLYVYLTDAGTE
ncbi:hypothetical protein M1B74_07655 [Bacteroides pyogenes]|uniref:hypothetical protein n=1 Tax=Bacteroides pyogenes TaxID=310300 RepID=UPI003B436703